MRSPVLMLLIFYLCGCNGAHHPYPRTKWPVASISKTANTVVTFSDRPQYYQAANRTNIEILKPFVNSCKCDSAHGKYYANTFLCKIATPDSTGDTILVFSLCGNIPEILTSGYDKPFIGWQCLDASKNPYTLPDSVFTNADTFILSRKYQYIIANILNVYED